MKNKKYIKLCLALAIVASMGLCACGNSADNTQKNPQQTESTDNVSDGTENTTESTDTESTETEEDSTWADYAVDKLDRSDEGYVLVWSDEFDGDSLDETKWSCQHGTGEDYGVANWGNGEQQNYTNREENVRVEDGQLIIVAQREDYEKSSYTSARIRTVTDDNESLFTFTYGRVEAKMRIEGGSGVWPAFWLLPQDTSIYGEWAVSGELDVMEAKGRVPGQIGGTAHFGRTWPNNIYSSKDYVFKEGAGISDYHTYALEWTPDCLKWYVDDECYSTLTNWYGIGAAKAANYTSPAPFDVPFYIILNLALGGNFDPQGIVNEKSFPAEMHVDFVRVFQKEGGYEDAVIAENGAKEDTFDYDESKILLGGRYLVYNGSFDQGKNRLAYWHTENMDVTVPNVLDADAYGNGDFRRSAVLTATGDGAKLYQTGLNFEEGMDYGVRFNITATEDTDIAVIIESSNGDKMLEQSVTVPAGTTDFALSTRFVSEVTDDMGTFIFALPNGGSIVLDDVIVMTIE